MKKLVILIAFILATVSSFATNWYQYGYMPCTEEGPSWSDPTEGTYTYGPGHLCEGCQFKIIYSTRWNNGILEVIVLSISRIAGSPCSDESCNDWNVIWAFVGQKIILDGANDNIDFEKDLNGGVPPGNQIITHTNIYSTALCFDTNNNECDNTIRCCKKTYYITLTRNENEPWQLGQTGMGYVVIPSNCPPTCEVACDQSKPYVCICEATTLNGTLSAYALKVKRHSTGTNECCYDIYLDKNNLNNICPVNNASIKIEYNNQTVYKSHSSNTPYHESVEPVKILDNFCVTAENNTPIKISVELKYGSSVKCSTEYTFNHFCDCCDRISGTILQEPVYDDGIQCCFNLTVSNPPENLCGISKIRILGLNNQELWRSYQPETLGVTTHKFCVDKASFGGQTTLPVEIKFYYQGDFGEEVLCSKMGVINACSNMSAPCTPDYQNEPWIEGVQPKPLIFDCPVPPYPVRKCTLNYSYRYRHVKDPMGNSIHRDVQVYNYSFNEGCDCDYTKIKNMLEAVWDNVDVKDVFGITQITDEVWPRNDTMCFYNFRSITSDCWSTEFYFSNGHLWYIRNKCPEIECCYAIYKVCYLKDGDGNITLVKNSFERQSVNTPLSQQCGSPTLPPCEGTNCTLWSIQNDAASNPKIGFNEDTYYIPCNSIVYMTNDHSENIVNIDCEENGTVQLTVFDLLGNAVIFKEFFKNEKKVSFSINELKQTGTHVLRIILNNKVIFYNKLNIIK